MLEVVAAVVAVVAAFVFVEGNLNSTFPTIWRVEKHMKSKDAAFCSLKQRAQSHVVRGEISCRCGEAHFEVEMLKS